MANNRFDRKLAKYLRVQRGDLTFQQFSDKMGLTVSQLHRIEQGEQSVRLGTLEHICRQLKCKVSDIFED